MKKMPTLAEPNILKRGRVFALRLLTGFFYALLNRKSGVLFPLIATAIFILFWVFGNGLGNTVFLFPLNKECYAKHSNQTSYYRSAAERDNTATQPTRLQAIPSLLQTTQSNHGSKQVQYAYCRQGQYLYRSLTQPKRAHSLLRYIASYGKGLTTIFHSSTNQLPTGRVELLCLILKKQLS